MRSTTIATALTLAAVALGAPAASASAPAVERWSEPYSDSFDCGAFVNEWSGTEGVTVKDWFDAAGELSRFTLQVRFREVDTNSETGDSVVLHGSVNETYDFVAGTRTVVGAVYMGSQRGAGTFIHDSGRLIENVDTGELISEAGVHEGYFAGVDELVCAALEG